MSVQLKMVALAAVVVGLAAGEARAADRPVPPAKALPAWDFSPVARYFKPVSGVYDAGRDEVTWVLELQQDLPVPVGGITHSPMMPVYLGPDGEGVAQGLGRMSAKGGRKGERITVVFGAPAMDGIRSVKVSPRSSLAK